MCEANAFLISDGEEKMLLEGVDLVKPEDEDHIRLVNIFGEQRIIKAKLKSTNLVNHKIFFEAS